MLQNQHTLTRWWNQHFRYKLWKSLSLVSIKNHDILTKHCISSDKSVSQFVRNTSDLWKKNLSKNTSHSPLSLRDFSAGSKHHMNHSLLRPFIWTVVKVQRDTEDVGGTRIFFPFSQCCHSNMTIKWLKRINRCCSVEAHASDKVQ